MRSGRGSTVCCPGACLDAGCQFLLFFLAYNGYQVVRGITDSGAIDAFANADQVIDLERSLGHLLRARLPAGADRARPVAGRLRQLHVPELALRDHHRLPRLALPVPQRALLLRPQHVPGRDGRSPWSATRSTRPRRRGCFPSEGFTDTIAAFTGVAQDSQTASLLVNQYAAVPSMHIAFSLMIAVPAAALSRHALARAAVVGLSAAGLLRHRRHRQPLLVRRRRRRRGRLPRRARRPRARPPARPRPGRGAPGRAAQER